VYPHIKNYSKNIILRNNNLVTAMKYLLLLFSCFFLNGCYFLQSSDGGGETDWQPPRKINPEDIALPEGYRIISVAEGFTFPTSVTFDDKGIPYVIESGYSYGEVFQQPKLYRIEENGNYSMIASGENNGPWTSVYFHEGYFIIAEGGQLKGGRILRISSDGKTEVLVDNLPGMGDHHTNGAIVGGDGYIYFGQGTATNSGVVGVDNYEFGWLQRFPDFHDLPCKDIIVTGENYQTDNILDGKGKVKTGAFSPYGTSTTGDQVIKGSLPCSGSIMRIPLNGGSVELVAWGLRNPFGLAFNSKGELYATDNGYDQRGSRPVFGTGDLLFKIEEGQWYGWPDYSGGVKLRNVEPLLTEYPNEPPRPAARFGVHSSSNGIDFSRNNTFGFTGEAFVAQFGDQAPKVGKTLSPVGFKVVRVDVSSGVIRDFAVNKGKTNGPASWLDKGGLERPVSLRFNPDGTELYIVDFGVMLMSKDGIFPQMNTGVLWKVVNEK
jgi:glucose/arabinose dehydrogenase